MQISGKSIDLLIEFKRAVEDADVEKAHRLYDEMLLEVTKVYEPDTAKLFDKAKGNMMFEYGAG